MMHLLRQLSPKTHQNKTPSSDRIRGGDGRRFLLEAAFERAVNSAAGKDPLHTTLGILGIGMQVQVRLARRLVAAVDAVKRVISPRRAYCSDGDELRKG